MGATQTENPDVVALGVEGRVPLADKDGLQDLLTSDVTFKRNYLRILFQFLPSDVSVVAVLCVTGWGVIM